MLYHIVPPRVEGEVLLPLNELKHKYPSLYDAHAAKYQGRWELMEQKIPRLNCKWNDVLQLSPVHPGQIRDALKEVGFGWQTMLCFEIDPEQVGMTGQNTVIFKHLPRQYGDFSMSDDEFEPFTVEALPRYTQLPEVTKTHFADAKTTEQRPMLFLWVPHVLFHGRIAVNSLKIVEIS